MHRSKESTTGPISKAFAGTSIWTVPKDDHIPTKRMGNRVHLLVKEPMQDAPEQIRPSPPTSARQLDDARFRHRIVHVGAQEAHAAEQNGDGEGLLDPDREFNDALDAVLQTRSIEMVMQFASDISGGSERLPPLKTVKFELHTASLRPFVIVAVVLQVDGCRNRCSDQGR